MSSVKLSSYHILYGLGTGKEHFRKFEQQLRTAGYQSARNEQTADIVIAHSSGCWYVTEDLSARLIVLVGLPLQSGKRLSTLLSAKRQQKEVSLATIAFSGFKSVYYTATHPKRSLRLYRQAEHLHFPQVPKGQVVCIMNRHDPWPRSSALQAVIEQTPFSFISLPGGHDNIWYEPQNYIDIINTYSH